MKETCYEKVTQSRTETVSLNNKFLIMSCAIVNFGLMIQ